MIRTERLIADVLAAAEGRIVGRVRLQKIFYLLHQCGLGAGVHFQYHHYGPYSKQLDEALDRAKTFHGIREKTEYRSSDGIPYSTFSFLVEGSHAVPDQIGELNSATARRLIADMKEAPSSVLELAATIHWIANKEHLAAWRPELQRRKGSIAIGNRVERALDLLRGLNLSPSAS